MLSDERLKELTKGGRQSLFWSKKIAETQEIDTLQSERLKIVKYIERNLLPETTETNIVWLQLRWQILSGIYIDLDKLK
jgi:hypothetical protein